jgi:hypothetical protein
VLYVFGGGYPFQVADMVVSFIAIKVVDYGMSSRLGDKRASDKTVNIYTVPIYGNNRIVFPPLPTENFPLAATNLYAIAKDATHNTV